MVFDRDLVVMARDEVRLETDPLGCGCGLPQRPRIRIARQADQCAIRYTKSVNRPMRGAALLLTALVGFACGAALAASSGNPTHDHLLLLPPAQQARTLGKGVGQGCVGVSAFPMGVTTSGKAKGLAYWSIRCKDGRSFAVQIAPDAQAVVVDCRLLQANGKECFKKF